MEKSVICHVKQLDDGKWAKPHLLKEHLSCTSELSGVFARNFSSELWGRLLGAAHDIGKSTEKWQEYIRRKSGFDEEANLEGKTGKLDHSGPSAKLCEEIFGKPIGRILSYCISGHHAGLPDWHPGKSHGQSALSFRLEHAGTGDIPAEFTTELQKLSPGSFPWKFDRTSLDLSLWIRMLFSCLVDADYLDTEEYMDVDRAHSRGRYCSLQELLQRFNKYMAHKTANAKTTPVNAIRQTVLHDCREAAKKRQGFFSLTVPTGGGKTLSSLAFALDHAVRQGMERIIYVVPYTSIIEQNADVFREALGEDQVVEHHSNIDEGDVTVRSRLSSENWDAPVVVTTSVQFFESLFASKPNQCRKLHNIANSVVILDEAQVLPAVFLAPILQAMNILTQRYRVTFVISTATQPAFESREGFAGLSRGSIYEIITGVPRLYKSLERVSVIYPPDLRTPISWVELASQLVSEARVLCVVSDRRSCRELFQIMPQGTYHLSALMCGQHRRDVIAEIRKKLSGCEPVRVISTQLVEAGVDLDFPVVYRAMAGFDSIAQAAGRCNREGKLPGLGRVIVFVAPRNAPPGILRKAMQATEPILRLKEAERLDHSLFSKFFEELYWKANSLDTERILDFLWPDSSDCGIQFRTAAEKFKFIDDTMQCSILVPYGQGAELLDILKRGSCDRHLLRKLQRYTVNVYTRDFENMKARGSLIEVFPGKYALDSQIEYDIRTGLLVDEVPSNPELFIL